MSTKAKIRPIETNSVLKKMFERAEIKDAKNSNWDELNELYYSIADSLVQIGTQVLNVVRFCEQTGYVRTAVEEQTISGLRKDLDEFSNLLIVVGDGAPDKAASLLAMLEAEPDIRQRVEAATLIGGRRWDLRLKSGADVKLPEDEMGLALRKLAVNHEEEAILDKDVVSIDVREEGRITVRTKPGAAQNFNATLTPAAGSPI